jgi:NAD(P)H dehydrogenase (quinone)
MITKGGFMNTLIVYTHPNHNSLNYSFLEAVQNGLKKNHKQHDIQVLDLYEEDFDPRLQFNETKRRRDMHVEPSMDKYRAQINWAEQIVYIYPIWWGRPPAMLLGYFDKLFSTNFAYKSKGKFATEGLIKNKSVIFISTMKGPTNYPLFLMNNAHKALMKRAVFKFIGFKKFKFFEFGSMESTEGKQQKALSKIENYFAVA